MDFGESKWYSGDDNIFEVDDDEEEDEEKPEDGGPVMNELSNSQICSLSSSKLQTERLCD